jgi:hypothetical protein
MFAIILHIRTCQNYIVMKGVFESKFQPAFHQNLNLFCFKLIFLVFLNRSDMLISKIIF